MASHFNLHFLPVRTHLQIFTGNLYFFCELPVTSMAGVCCPFLAINERTTRGLMRGLPRTLLAITQLPTRVHCPMGSWTPANPTYSHCQFGLPRISTPANKRTLPAASLSHIHLSKLQWVLPPLYDCRGLNCINNFPALLCSRTHCGT